MSKKVEKKEKVTAEWDYASTEISLESMLKSGVHFGHLKSRRNPKMNEYIFGLRNGVNIIDLEKSLVKLNEALSFMEGIKKEGKKILFVGTKKQAKGLMRKVAEASEMPFVVERWLGGTFTNFRVIRGRTKYLKDSQEQMESGAFEKYTKLEKLKKVEEIERLERKMGGIKNMSELPAAIFVVGAKEDSLAIEEALKVNVPVIAVADTNNDPENIDYIIPANDDAVSSIRMILGAVAKTLTK
ncbi:30S ribosomal protein S2 [Patescibacteria group bacterium]